jgi:hypothetical protein
MKNPVKLLTNAFKGSFEGYTKSEKATILAVITLFVIGVVIGGTISVHNHTGQQAAALTAQTSKPTTQSQQSASQPAPSTRATSSTGATSTGSTAAAKAYTPYHSTCSFVAIPHTTTNQSVSPSNYLAGTTTVGYDGENYVCTDTTGHQTVTNVQQPSNNIHYVADPSLATPGNTYTEPADQYCAAYAGTSYFATCENNYNATQ